MFEFHDETEIRVLHVVFNPLLDAAIQFRIKVVLPVSSFTFWLIIIKRVALNNFLKYNLSNIKTMVMYLCE